MKKSKNGPHQKRHILVALSKQWDVTIKYIEDHRLEIWSHNKTIQKARESKKGEIQMGDKIKKSNKNNIFGNVFNGPANIVAGSNNFFKEQEIEKVATYTPEPVWRSPITMAILSWMSVLFPFIGIYPFYKVFEPLINLLIKNKIDENYNYVHLAIFIIWMLILILIFWLRSITKKETRHPIFFNYAISGLGRKITIEKIHIEKCPICGGKMKYFNKPVEWRDIIKSDGKIKHEVIKRVPALQCKRNSDHWYEVDPATDKLK